jgi:hypothetical protein
MRNSFFFLLLVLTFRGYAQMNTLDTFFARSSHYPIESVYLHCDRYIAAVGDTIWWAGYVLNASGLSGLSTTLWVELFDAHGQFVLRKQFPVMDGFSVGQISLPTDLSSGRYWLRAWTRYQLNFDTNHLFVTPIEISRPGDTAVGQVIAKKPFLPGVSVESFGHLLLATATNDSSISIHLDADPNFEGMDRPLELVLMEKGQQVIKATFALDKQRPWEDIVFPLSGETGWGEVCLLEGRRLIGEQGIYLGDKRSADVQMQPDTVSTEPGGYNAWTVHIEAKAPFITSIAITDADRSDDAPRSILENADSLSIVGLDELTGDGKGTLNMDTAFLSWKGIVRTRKGRIMNHGYLVTILSKEGMQADRPRLMPIDSNGRIYIDHAIFFDTALLSYSLNEPEGYGGNDLHMSFDRQFFPGFKPPHDSVWSITSGRRPFKYPSMSDPVLPKGVKVQELPEVTVKGNVRKELDDRYATGIFSELTPYSFDLRQDKTVHTVWAYLRKNLPGFIGGPDMGMKPSFNGKEVIFYVDGDVKTVEEIENYWYEEIAYIKAFHSLWVDETPFMKWKTGYSDFTLNGPSNGLKVPEGSLPPVICLFTRKDADIRTAWPGLPTLALPGYTTIVPWTGPHGVSPTLYWRPFQQGNDFRIRFYNGNAERLRVIIEGINAEGKVVHYEALIPAQ